MEGSGHSRALRQQVHILIVDDDEVDVMAVKRALKASGIENPISIAADGIEALAMLRGQGTSPVPKPYLILLDLNLPRMKGVEFLRELRRDPEHRCAVVFVLTTSAAAEDKARAYEQHVAGYIVKASADYGFRRVLSLIKSYLAVVELP